MSRCRGWGADAGPRPGVEPARPDRLAVGHDRRTGVRWRVRRAGARWWPLWLGCALGCRPGFGAPAGAPPAADGPEAILHLRSFYLGRTSTDADPRRATAAGGWLRLRSGWLGGRLRLGLTGYTTQKIDAPAQFDGTRLLAPGQRSFSVLGEANACLRLAGAEISLGRFLVDQFEVNPQDTRMVPRTFAGGAATGNHWGLTWFAGLLTAMKPRESSQFINMATAAGAPGHADMRLLSLRAAPHPTLRLGLAAYQVPEVLSSGMSELLWQPPAGPWGAPRVGLQYLRQAAAGQAATWNAGVRLGWNLGPLTLSGTLVQTGEAAGWRSPYGSWPGFTSRIINNFNRAGEHARALDLRLEGSGLGLPGVTLTGSATFGDHAQDAATGRPLPDQNEYDLTLDLRPPRHRLPAWVGAPWLRLRYARVERWPGPGRAGDDEVQVILNWPLGGAE